MVALHGAMGGYDQAWILAKALAADVECRVVAVSRPGYLGTGLDLGRTADEQAHLICALLDALDIADAIVIAVSAGGPAALQFAALYPSRCRSLILVSACTGRLQTPPEILKRMRAMQMLSRVPGLTALMRWRAMRSPDKATIRSIRDPELRVRTLEHPRAGPLLRALQQSVLDRIHDRLTGTINDIRHVASLGQLPTLPIPSPTLIVHGQQDDVVPFEHANALRRKVPQAELLAIPQGSHVALFTHLDLVSATAAPLLGGRPGLEGRS